MTLDLTLEDPRWQALELAPVAAQVVAATLGHLSLEVEACEISLLACTDARIAILNDEFRGKASATNVLSWPTEDLAASSAGASPARPQIDFMGEISLGDIAIAYETCAREAAAAGRGMLDHVQHLIVHGILHLLGYDHICDLDAALMEQLEVEILGKLGIDNPYIENDSPVPGHNG